MFVSTIEFESKVDEAKTLLKSSGFWSRKMARTQVRLVWFFHSTWTWSHGLAYDSSPPRIEVPRFSVVYLTEGKQLLNTILHEYAHTYVWAHPKITKPWFEEFAEHKNYGVFDPSFHVNEFACYDPEEDFCETLVEFCLPTKKRSEHRSAVRKKLQLLGNLPAQRNFYRR